MQVVPEQDEVKEERQLNRRLQVVSYVHGYIDSWMLYLNDNKIIRLLIRLVILYLSKTCLID